eukprot:gene29313-35387_t
MNAGMEDWYHGLPASIARSPPEHFPDVVIAWYNGRLGICYVVMSTGPNESDWKVVKNMDQIEVINPSELSARHRLSGNDPRLYLHNHHLYVEYFSAVPGTRRDFMLYADRLFYDKSIDALYVQPPQKQLNIDPEMGRHVPQKNWMAFEFHHAKGNRPILLYVYSINPHRVVHMHSLNGSSLNMTTLCVTKHKPTANLPVLWKYDLPRGGAPAKLVHTVHGYRFLTFFHSPHQNHVTYIESYHMGAYLFNPQPPFAITHITPDLIACKQCYDEKLGWTYKAVDYINFPMGFVVRANDTLFLSIGKNDKSAYLLKMNKTALIEYMVPVESSVVYTNPVWT